MEVNMDVDKEEFERFIRSYIRLYQFRNGNKSPKSVTLPAMFEVNGVEVVFPVRPVEKVKG